MTDTADPRPRGRLLFLRPPATPRPPWTVRRTKRLRHVGGSWREHRRLLGRSGYLLTENEAKVAWLVSWHCTTPDIVETLGVSRSTVTATIARLMAMLGVRGRGPLLRRIRSIVEGVKPPGGVP
jgi:DNA-binding CsgD family transcriptional regulator